jgi:AraC-like DNA-binding protein
VYFVNRVILKALGQPEIFAGIEQDSILKYAQSNLTKEQVHLHKERLTEILKIEKLYRDPQINIYDLARRLGVPSKTLSQVINQSFDKNFFDLINSYRVSEAQKILKESLDKKLTVLEVMYSVGFNSKSSFNTAFKKVTGKTPSEYRKKVD